MVNKQAMREWALALHSGRYTQGGRKLATFIGDRIEYCCLGVACEIFHERLNLSVSSDPYNTYRRFDMKLNYLPTDVYEYMGIDSEQDLFSDNPVIGTDASSKPIYAAMANDELHWSFHKIAHAVNDYYDLNINWNGCTHDCQ